MKKNSWFFEKINNIDKLLVRLTKTNKKTQINKIRGGKRDYQNKY
jgi:hypothetical protein